MEMHARIATKSVDPRLSLSAIFGHKDIAIMEDDPRQLQEIADDHSGGHISNSYSCESIYSLKYVVYISALNCYGCILRRQKKSMSVICQPN